MIVNKVFVSGWLTAEAAARVQEVLGELGVQTETEGNVMSILGCQAVGGVAELVNAVRDLDVATEGNNSVNDGGNSGSETYCSRDLLQSESDDESSVEEDDKVTKLVHFQKKDENFDYDDILDSQDFIF